MKLYGIKNCDSVKKAIKFLESNSISYNFIDLKKDTLSYDLLEYLLLNYEDELINKRSKTYREVKESWLQASCNTDKIVIIKSYPTIIKRPVLIADDNVLIGFKEENYISLILNIN